VFSHVIAADISADHLRIAETVLAERAIRNVSLVHLNTLKDLAEIGPFDVFFSVIVLQHNPPPIMAYILRKILQQLNHGGVGYFQIPTYAKGYAFGIDEYLCQIKEGHDRMEGHVLPQKDLNCLRL
jgi:SAM-dependent methyltransferase